MRLLAAWALAALVPRLAAAVRADSVNVDDAGNASEDRSAFGGQCEQHRSEAECRAEEVQCFWRPRLAPPCAPAAAEHCAGMRRADCGAAPEVCHWEPGDIEDVSCVAGASPCWAVNDQSECDRLKCIFRQKPLACVERIPANCIGLDQPSCEGYADICEWVDDSVESSSVTFCRSLAAADVNGENHTVLTLMDRCRQMLSAAGDSGCVRRVLRAEDSCRAALPVYLAVLLALLACLFSVCCCCCCAARKPAAGGSARGSVREGSKRQRVSEFPPPPGTNQISITVPKSCPPGRPFTFNHPSTGQQMQATAPTDGSRVVRVQSAM